MKAFDKSILRAGLLAAVAISALSFGGCASPMYSGTPDDTSNPAIAPAYAPGAYEPPYQVGARRDEDEQPAEWTAEQKFEYRGGRDPVTGRAKQQM